MHWNDASTWEISKDAKPSITEPSNAKVGHIQGTAGYITLQKKRRPQVQNSFILTLDSEWHHTVSGKVNPPAVTNRQVLRGITWGSNSHFFFFFFCKVVNRKYEKVSLPIPLPHLLSHGGLARAPWGGPGSQRCGSCMVAVPTWGIVWPGPHPFSSDIWSLKHSTQS